MCSPRRFKIRRARDCARNVRPSRAANNDPHPRAPGALALSLMRARDLKLNREKGKREVRPAESEFRKGSPGQGSGGAGRGKTQHPDSGVGLIDYDDFLQHLKFLTAARGFLVSGAIPVAVRGPALVRV